MSRFRPEGEGWERVNAKKLLVDPFKVLKEAAIPAVGGLIALFSSGRPELALIAVPLALAIIAAVAVIPWLTTYYRVDADRLEMHTGLLNRKKRTAPLERVRSVDLTAGVLHRVLGLRKVEIGTGVDDEQFALDALAVNDAEQLRTVLLAKRAQAPASAPTAPVEAVPGGDGWGEPTSAPLAPAPAPVELARFEWSWARFAPLSLTRLVVLAAAIGFLSQFVDDLPIFDADHLKDAWAWVTSFSVVLVVLVVLVGAVVLWCLAAVSEYVAKWWALRLVSDGDNLNLTAGLFSTRSTSVEEKRVRGVDLREPLLMRAAHGAEISAMTTGLSDNTPSLLPAVPLSVAQRVGAEVLGDPLPMTTPLVPHGWLARRRAYVGALIDIAITAVIVGVLEWAIDRWPDTFAWAPELVLRLPWVLLGITAVLSAVAAEASYRHLGHALTERHLVVGSGTFTRRREVLQRDGIIGWVIEQSIFQRRLGLADLVATTAAGGESVRLHDVALPVAVALAHASSPHAVGEFLDAPASA
ncbi:MAG: PH domain-containing protein [Nocardioides sp.]|uniref:PH domain-containing protein n=1 Tax=Nocardioides sp. TaxID=35761 RepID=UPI003F0ED966